MHLTTKLRYVIKLIFLIKFLVTKCLKNICIYTYLLPTFVSFTLEIHTSFLNSFSELVSLVNSAFYQKWACELHCALHIPSTDIKNCESSRKTLVWIWDFTLLAVPIRFISPVKIISSSSLSDGCTVSELIGLSLIRF